MKEIQNLPIMIIEECKWYVASCPLDIVAQGKTEQEVKENMEDLINEYFEDEDTPKPETEIELTSVSFIPVKLQEKNLLIIF